MLADIGRLRWLRTEPLWDDLSQLSRTICPNIVRPKSGPMASVLITSMKERLNRGQNVPKRRSDKANYGWAADANDPEKGGATGLRNARKVADERKPAGRDQACRPIEHRANPPRHDSPLLQPRLATFAGLETGVFCTFSRL